MREKLKIAGAFLLGLSLASSVTWAQLGGRGRNVVFVDGTTISPTSVTASGTGDQFVCTSTTATCEVESSASATTMTATVPAFDIGPTATPGSNDRLACFSYGATGSKTRVACVDAEGDMTANALNIGTTTSQARLHVLTTTTDFGPNSYGLEHAVFGNNSLASGGGAVYLSYNTSANEGIIGALDPGNAWRPLTLSASQWKFRQNGGATPIANITGTGAFNSAAASGNQAFTCTNVGCRLSLGNTARYLVDDGTNLEFIAPVQATTFEATTASGATLRGGGASGPMLIEPTTADSQTSATVPAILIKPANAITAGDALLIVQNSAGTQRFRIRDDGNTFASQFIARYHFGDQTPVEIGTYMTPGAEKNPIQLTAVGNFTADDVNLVSIRNNTSTLVAAFSKDGLLRVNKSNAAKPTCNADNRGRVFYLDGAAGVADTYEICMKDASDVYAWKTIVAP